jgi:hypothetical protein
VRPSFSTDRLRPGTRVLARLSRGCTMNGANCGDFMVIANDGTLLSDYISDDQMSEKQGDPRPLRLQDLPVDLLREGDIGELLRSAAGIASAVLIDNRHLPSAGGVWRCSLVTWVVASDDSLPSYVRFPRKESCYTESEPVQYLLPVPKGFRGDTLSVDCCPRVLQVKSGEASALGVASSHLPDVVRHRADGRLELAEPSWQRRKREQ